MEATPLESFVPVPRRLAPVVGNTSGSAAARLPLGWSNRRLGLGLAAAGWALLVVMWITGAAEIFGHDQASFSAVPAIGLFLVGWLVMVAAMMLPSSLPTLERVDGELVTGPRASAPRFMAGYFVAWAAFGVAALVGDGILHRLVDEMSWLAERPSLIAGGVAMFAGLTEMLGRPAAPLLPSHSRDRSSFGLGRAHGLDRIRRCWPLMLFAMAIGMSNPVWMVGLTLVMILELRPSASTALRLIGLAIFVLGAAVVLEPSLMPVLLGTA